MYPLKLLVCCLSMFVSDYRLDADEDKPVLNMVEVVTEATADVDDDFDVSKLQLVTLGEFIEIFHTIIDPSLLG